MGYRKQSLIAGEYYHIFNRGNNRQEIFIEERNYHYFYAKIKEAFFDEVKLIAYCLMPNHFHLIVFPEIDNELEKAMQRISTGYTRAINKAYNMSGHLFEGTYKSKLIPNNEYLLHLSRHIHRNPLKANLVRKIDWWMHSSYNVYTGHQEDELIEKSVVLDQFRSAKEYQDFVENFNEESTYFLKDVLFY